MQCLIDSHLQILMLQAHVGKQPIARWYFPPEVDYRLSLLPPDAKGLVVWIIEAKVKSTPSSVHHLISPSAVF